MKDSFDRDAFERLRAALNRIAKPNLTGENIDSAIDGARNKMGPDTTPEKMAGHRITKGFLGEVDREQFIQDKGEISVTDKTHFNQVNRGGIDGATIGLNDKGLPTLFLDDNKAYTRVGPARSASALQENFDKNLLKLVQQWREAATLRSGPERELFERAVDLAEPGQYEKRITNAGGNVDGTTIADATLLDVEAERQAVASAKAAAGDKQAAKPMAPLTMQETTGVTTLKPEPIAPIGGPEVTPGTAPTAPIFGQAASLRFQPVGGSTVPPTVPPCIPPIKIR